VTNTLAADTDKLKIQLLQNLAGAETESQGRAAESAVWEFWFSQSPTTEIRTSLDAGRERIRAYDFEAAENHLNRVVEAAPDYAEGYNQRAYARFLRENYSESLTDLEKTLELEPHHFGAMSGELLRRAVTIHPWIQERGALPKELWPERYRRLHEPGQEI